MEGADRMHLRFATRALLLQLATVALAVLLCTAASLLLAVRQLREEAESTALSIARTVAEDPDVRTLVTTASADPGTPRAEDLHDGELQTLASRISARTGALFVVLTDDHGIRLAHPDPSLLGETVSTPYQEVLRGHEVVEWETGTLGESARAKTPIRDAGGTPVGEVSVGIARAGVFDDLPPVLWLTGLATLGSLALATLAALLLRRRWERLTLGVQPEELIVLVQNQTAVLDGVDDGVIGVDPEGRIRVCNAAAARMLGISSPIGRPLAELGLSGAMDAGADGAPSSRRIVVGDRVLYLDLRPVERNGRRLGLVMIVRDRTDLVALADRLERVRTMTSALRVQRHEFANRMHVAAGLIDADRVDEARSFLGELVERGAVDYPVPGLDRLADPFLRSFLGAKGIEAGERGVTLRVSDESELIGTIDEAEDLAAVLGNLVDNAITAAAGAPTPRWAEILLLHDGADLVLTVADSGPGLPSTEEASRTEDTRTVQAEEAMDGRLESGGRPDEQDAVHGHGLGLPLSREIARRRGGDLWVVDHGGPQHGAVFAARLEGVLRIERERAP